MHYNDVDEEQLLKHTSKYTVYGRRWWLLSLVTLLSALQGGYWNNFGPIAPACKPMFGWNDGTIALLANWGPICYLLAVFPCAKMMDEKGLRPAMLLATSLVAFGALLRCVQTSSISSITATVLMHSSQFLNGLAGPVAMSAGPVLSAVWFPPQERITATAIVSSANYGGTALMFILGPALVPAPLPNSNGEYDAAQIDLVASHLFTYMVYEAAAACALLFAVVAYFPNAPSLPPCRSAGVKRIEFRKGLAELRQVRVFWWVSCAYGSVTGFYGAWGSMLAPNLENVLPPDSAESTAGWLGCWSALAGMFGGCVFGIFSDRLVGGRKKALLLALCVLGSVTFTWFALICARVLPMTKTTLYISCIAGGLLVNSSIPLFYEWACEAAHPIAEGLTTGVLTTVNNIWCGIFLVIPMIPGIGTSWMNWAVVAAALSAFLVLLPQAEARTRFVLDSQEEI